MASCIRSWLKVRMTDLLWFEAELFVRLILVCVWGAAGLVALAVAGIVALILMVWKRTKLLKEDKRA